jgi:DNA-binding NtrC family response regulator
VFAQIKDTLIMRRLILIVDNDDGLRLLASELIERAGYATLAASRASDALLLLEKAPTIALLLTDIMMPIINGFVLADMAIMRWPDLCVIYMSDLSNLRDAGEQPGRHHGIILTKPLGSEQVSTAIAMTLSRPLPPGETIWRQGLARETLAPPTGARAGSWDRSKD